MTHKRITEIQACTEQAMRESKRNREGDEMERRIAHFSQT
jgi:hypothetical protein